MAGGLLAKVDPGVARNKEFHLGLPYLSIGYFGIPAGVWDRVLMFDIGSNPANGPYVDLTGNGNCTKFAGATPTAQSWGLQVTDGAGLQIHTGLEVPTSGTVIYGCSDSVSPATGHHTHWIHGDGTNFAYDHPVYTSTASITGHSSIFASINQGATHAIAQSGSVNADSRQILDPRETRCAPSAVNLMCYRWDGATGKNELFDFRGYATHTILPNTYANLAGQNLTIGPLGTAGNAQGNIYAACVATSAVSLLNIYRTMQAIAEGKYKLTGLKFDGYVTGKDNVP